MNDVGRAALVEAAQRLASAIIAHARSVPGADSDDVRSLFAQNEALRDALLGYSDVQFEYTGTAWPLSQLRDSPGTNDADDEDDDEGRQATPSAGVSVIARFDYSITDPDALAQWLEASSQDAPPRSKSPIQELIEELEERIDLSRLRPAVFTLDSTWVAMQELSENWQEEADGADLTGAFAVDCDSLLYWTRRER